MYRRKKKKDKPLQGQAWGWDKQLEVVRTYLIVGSAPKTQQHTGVPAGTIRQWKMADWWKEAEAEIRQEEEGEMLAEIQDIVKTTMAGTKDRVKNGEYVESWDKEANKFVFRRKPLSANTLNKITVDMMKERNILLDKPKRRQEKDSTEAQLTKLAATFAEFTKFKKTKTIEGEVIEPTDTGSN